MTINEHHQKALWLVVYLSHQYFAYLYYSKKQFYFVVSTPDVLEPIQDLPSRMKLLIFETKSVQGEEAYRWYADEPWADFGQIMSDFRPDGRSWIGSESVWVFPQA